MKQDDRMIPQALEAERAILGSILLDNSAMNLMTDIITKDDLFSEAHRITLESMTAIYEAGQTVDLVTLSQRLSNNGQIEKAGGAAYLSALTDGVPVGTSVAVSEYARIIKSKSILRRAINASHNVIARCMEQTDEPEDIIELGISQFYEIADQKTVSGFQSAHQIIQQSFATFEALLEHGAQIQEIQTGLKDLDTMTLGLHPSELVIIAARPSMGKTAWALNVAAEAAIRKEKTVAIFSLEMSKEALITRLMCSEGEIDSHKMRSGFLGNQEWGKLVGALGRIAGASLYIEDSSGLTVAQIRAKARRLNSEHPLNLIIVDYLQLVAGGKKHENRNQEVTHISQSLKAMAKEMKIPVIAVSQLNRGPEQRRGANIRPQLSDLRESGALEQDADTVIFIYRPKGQPEIANGRGVYMLLIIGKQRNGPIGEVPVVFLKPYTKFVSMAPEYMVEEGESESTYSTPYKDE